MINKRQRTKKLALALAVALALPIGVTAQGLFQRGVTDEEYYGFGGSEKQNSMLNRGDVQTYGIIDNQTFGQSPIGSGIIILLAAGAGYATLKRRKEDKQ